MEHKETLLSGGSAKINSNHELIELPLLHQAITSRNLEKVREILANDIERKHINSRDHIGRYPFHVVVEIGDIDIFDLISDKHRAYLAFDSNLRSILAYCLLYYNGDPTDVRLKMFSKILEEDIVKKTISANIIKDTAETLLHLSTQKGLIHITQILLALDPHVINNKDVHGRTPIFNAIFSGNIEIINILIKAGANLNIFNANSPSAYCSCLHLAVLNGNADILEYLLSNVQDSIYNATNENGDTALHLALSTASEKIINLLIEFWPRNKLDVKNKLQQTPYDIAINQTRIQFDQRILNSIKPVSQHTKKPEESEDLYSQLMGVYQAADPSNPLTISSRTLADHLPEIAVSDTSKQLEKTTTTRSLLDRFNSVASDSYPSNSQPSENESNLTQGQSNPLDLSHQINTANALNYEKKPKNNSTDTPSNRPTAKPTIDTSGIHTSMRHFPEDVIITEEIRAHMKVQELPTLEPLNLKYIPQHEPPSLHKMARDGTYDELQGVLSSIKDEESLKTQLPDSQETALHLAALKGNEDNVDLLISKEEMILTESKSSAYLQFIEIPNIDGDLPLHYAIRYQYNRESIDSKNGSAFLRKFININTINATNCKRQTCMHFATIYSTAPIIDFLLRHNADIDAQDELGNTSLHYAITSGNSEVVSLLINYGAKIDIKNKEGKTAKNLFDKDGNSLFHHLTMMGNMKLFAIATVDEMKVKNFQGQTLLHMAAKENQTKVAQQLIEFYKKNSLSDCIKEVDSDGNNALHHSVMCRSHKTFTFIEAYKIIDIHQVDSKGNSLLHMAANNGENELVRDLVLTKKLDLFSTNTLKQSPMHCALLYNHFSLADWLINYCHKLNSNRLKDLLNKDINIPGSVIGQASLKMTTALHLAAKDDNLEIVQSMLKFGAKVDLIDHQQMTALDMAILTGHFKVAQVLFKQAQITFLRDIKIFKDYLNTPIDSDSNTFLHKVIALGKIDLIHLFLTHGANLNTKNAMNMTPLLLALELNQFEIADIIYHYYLENNLLVDWRKQINQIDNNESLLHKAIKDKNLHLTRFLISHGADAETYDAHGKQALDYAVADKSFLIAEALCPISTSSGVSKLMFYAFDEKSKADETSKEALLKWLVTEGKIQLSARTKNGDNLLHLAAKNNHNNAVIILLECAEKLSKVLQQKTQRSLPTTPIKSAINNEQPEVIQESTPSGLFNSLMKLISTTDQSETRSRTASISSPSKNQQSHNSGKDLEGITIETFINAQNSDKDTPLHIAIRKSNVAIVKLLLEKKADLNIENAKGETAKKLLQARYEYWEGKLGDLLTSNINVAASSPQTLSI